MPSILPILMLALLWQAAPASDRGWTVLEQAIKAAGGREKLAGVKDMSFELQTRLVTPQGDVDIQSKNLFVSPDTVRQDMNTPFGELKIGFNATEGWRKGPSGLEKLPADQVRRTQTQVARVNLLFRPPTDRKNVRWVRNENVDSHACDVIEITGAGEPLQLYVDRASGNVVKRSYRAEDPGGKMANVEEFLSDFRDVDGLKLSFKVREMRDGKLARESATRTMKLNTGLKPDDLLREFR